MSPEKVWNALERYDRELGQDGHEARQMAEAAYTSRDPADLTPDVLFAHCRWMAGRCLESFRREHEEKLKAAAQAHRYSPSRCAALTAEAAGPLEKAMRWLGYIQGVCHALGRYSCNELRDHSRGGEGEFKPAREEHGGSAEPPAKPGYAGPTIDELLATEKPD